ncbi:MAG: hypothetical protein ACRDPH_08780, partial [Marmoricola sp.]
YQLARAGSALPRSLQIGLTYPFLDAAVGNSPQVARNLHIGDYVNLSVYLNLDLTNLAIGLPKLGDTIEGALCSQLRKPSASQLGKLCDSLAKTLNTVQSPTISLPNKNPLAGLGGASTSTKSQGNKLLGGSGPLGLPRARLGSAYRQDAHRSSQLRRGDDSGIGRLLAQGVTR